MKFNRDAKQLAFFLSKVWKYMDEYGMYLPGDVARVSCVARTLESGAAQWLMPLHDATAKELCHFYSFMLALRQ